MSNCDFFFFAFTFFLCHLIHLTSPFPYVFNNNKTASPSVLLGLDDKDDDNNGVNAVPPASNLKGLLSPDFQQWLHKHGYSQWDFAGTSGAYGLQSLASFGGRDYADQKISHRPVIFIHGNGDGALSHGEEKWSQGWSASIEHFMHAGGYSRAELYAITYGDRKDVTMLQNHFNCPTAKRLRHFVEAVLEYTGAKQVDIIAHSMGVSYARLIIGGNVLKFDEENDPSHVCQLGGRGINGRVHTLIAMAGANYGLCLCANKGVSTTPVCDHELGFWPGNAPVGKSTEDSNLCASKDFKREPTGHHQYAMLLEELNQPYRNYLHKEAGLIVSLWSDADQVLGPSNLAYGRLTSLIPGSDCQHIYHGINHFALKWATVADQLAILEQEIGSSPLFQQKCPLFQQFENEISSTPSSGGTRKANGMETMHILMMISTIMHYVHYYGHIHAGDIPPPALFV